MDCSYPHPLLLTSRLLCADTALNRSHWLALGGRLPEAGKEGQSSSYSICLGSQDGLLSRRDPQGSRPAPKHHQVAGPERTFAGEGGAAQLRHCSFAQRALSGLLAGRAPHGLFSALCTEYKSSSLTGLPHKLAIVTKKEIQNECCSSQAASVQASWEESPRPQPVAS